MAASDYSIVESAGQLARGGWPLASDSVLDIEIAMGPHERVFSVPEWGNFPKKSGISPEAKKAIARSVLGAVTPR